MEAVEDTGLSMPIIIIIIFFLQIISNSQIIFTTSVYVLSPMSKLLQYLNLCINIFLSMKVHG